MARYEAIAGQSELSLDANSSVHPIHTRVDRVEAWFEAELNGDGSFDLSSPASGLLTVYVEDLKSGNALIDRVMQGRLNIRRYPAIKAALKELRETGEAGHYRAVGDISFHGVTHQMEDELTISQTDGDAIEISGSTTVDVRRFNVEPPRLFVLKVEPEVKVTLKVVARRVDP